MNVNAIPLFAMLRDRLGYLSQRQQLVAQNVANADTPGFTPRDLQAFTVNGRRAEGLAAAPSEAGHIALAPPQGSASGWNVVTEADSETTLDGNQVSLEDQMLKMQESRMNYDAAIGFYQKSLGLLRMAARAPGR